MSDRRSDMLRHFQTMLHRWNGANVLLNELTATQRTLRLHLQFPEQNDFLLVACIDPMHINAPIAWTNAQIRVSIDIQDGFLVIDEVAGTRIHTGSVEIKEYGNPKLG